MAWNDNIVLKEPGAEPIDLPHPGIPSWSPDGQFLTTGADPNSVVVLDLMGNELLTIPEVEDFDWQPKVS